MKAFLPLFMSMNPLSRTTPLLSPLWNFFFISRQQASSSPGRPWSCTAGEWAPWRVGDVVVSRGNAGWTTSKSGHPCPCQNYSQGPPAKKTARGSLLNRPSCPPNNPTGQGTEPNFSMKASQSNQSYYLHNSIEYWNWDDQTAKAVAAGIPHKFVTLHGLNFLPAFPHV